MKLFICIIFFSLIFSDDLKNVQVLDITSNREMKKYMKSISKDLGTKCKSCHIMDDKSLDTPEKDIAREMMILTRHINEILLTIENNFIPYARVQFGTPQLSKSKVDLYPKMMNFVSKPRGLYVRLMLIILNLAEGTKDLLSI